MKTVAWRKLFSGTAVTMATVLLLASGCQTPLPTRGTKTSGFLKDYSQLKPGGSGRAKLVYTDSAADFAKYDKIIVDPVTVWVKGDSRLAKLPQKDVTALVTYLDATVRASLKQDYQIVDRPAAGVMRLRIAITDGKKANVALNTLSSVVPVGLALDLLKLAATGTHASVGEASVEAELTDAVTGQRLLAAVDARAGRKVIASGNFTAWGDVKDPYDYWAKKLQQRLTELRKR